MTRDIKDGSAWFLNSIGIFSLFVYMFPDTHICKKMALHIHTVKTSSYKAFYDIFNNDKEFLEKSLT